MNEHNESINDADNFFTINGTGDPNLYTVELNHFGEHVKAIQLNGIQDIGKPNHGILRLLHDYINRIKKLTLNSCTFISNEFLSQPMPNMTHLKFCKDIRKPIENEDSLVTIDLPECGNLIQFDYRGRQCISTGSLERMIRQNSSLQSLLLYDFLDENTTKLNQIITFIAGNLYQLRELALVDEWFGEWHPLSRDSIDRIVNSLKHLESLAISIDSNVIELLQCLGTNCTGIKYLALHPAEVSLYGKIKGKIFEVLSGSFYQIEHLHLFLYDDDVSVYAGFLELLRKCQSLQTITYHIDPHENQMTLGIERFYGEFIKTINITRKPNAKIEVKNGAETIIALTVNEVAWVNGYKWINSESKISLFKSNAM